MATIGKNQFFEIKNGDGSSFHNLVLRKSAVESVVMSLGDKISGDVYYKDNTLSVTMHEYITYNGVNYMLVNPPTIVKEGIVSDNSELKGMTKYSFVFYHPMCLLSNFPFTDVAVTSDETRYLSESKVFSWIGKPADFVAKMNKNLVGTEWIVELSSRFPQDKLNELSDVIPFDNTTIADACKIFYDTWGVPYVVDKVASTETSYAAGKRFKLVMGLPSNEIYANATAQQQNTPFVFQMGHGVGLKNNSRTPRNNKIITRISGYGSENNIPYGYPQVRWYGTAGQAFTYGDHAGVYNNVTIEGVHFDKIISYPIYKGILDGEYVELIKHPFTRTHLMPSVYRTTLFNKISFYDAAGEANTDYDPDITLVDYYDAVYSAQYPYPNTINLQAPSYESHEFEDEKPELGEAHIISATPLNNDLTPASSWDDSLDDEGNYKQSYFQMVLSQLSFDLYACASITEEMQINMRSGACLGCTFTVQVDWDDYKRNFYDDEGNFAPNGSQRDLTKYPKSNQGSISLVLQKDNSTFGTLMPNMYQYPKGETSVGAGDGDTFVILGISLPESYIFSAEWRLDADMKSYMLENNVHYFDYPLKFDEDFLFRNENILSQIRPNTVVRFNYAGQTQALFVKQITIKYGEQALPQYDITLTDNVEVVLNQIGQVAEDVEKLSTLIAILRQSYGKNVWNELAKKLSKTQDDTAAGYITMLKGLQIGASFVPDILGEGGVLRMRADGKVELVTDILYARMKAYFDSVEIREYQHTGGNRIASVAGNRMCRVEWIQLVEEEVEEETVTREVILEQTPENLENVDYFRCYFRAEDDETEVRNNWVVGDMAYCHVTSITNSSDNPEQKGLNQKHLWRLVIGRNTEGNLTADGEAYIDLSNRSTETISGTNYTGYQSGSDIPAAQDDIIQLGNVNDTTRQGAIVEFVTGTDAPSYQIFQNINSFSLNGKNQIGFGYNTSTGRAYLNVFGDFRFGARPNTQGSYLSYNSQTGELNIKAHVEFTNSDQELDTLVQSHQRDDSYDDTQVRALISGLQDQIDGQVESWFYDYPPVHVDAQGAPDSKVPLNVAPYSDWTTDALKIAHLGDTFTDNSSGYCWRFTRNETTQAFEWTIIEDSAVITALQNAARAQDTADHKRRVFLVQPTPPYDAGDMWVNATYPATGTKTFDNDIVKCITSKAATDSFDIADWTKASDYTNDDKVNSFISELLNGSSDSEIAMTAAFKAIRAAMNDGVTDIYGGLILTNEIEMRDTAATPSVWSGISGMYDSTALGNGVAIWAGGARGDWEAYLASLTPAQRESAVITNSFAKSLLRFDGSGYLAGGNITWNANGVVSIKDVTTIISSNDTDVLNALVTFNSAFHFNLAQDQTTVLSIAPQAAFTDLYIANATTPSSPYHVATEDWANGQFVTKAFFNRLFQAFNGSTAVDANDLTTTIDNIKAMVSFWSQGGITALGQGSGGGGGGGSTTLYGLNDVSKNAAGDGVLGAADGYVLTYNASTNHWYAAPTAPTYTLPQATSGALGGIKIGYSASGKNYAIVLDNNGKAYVNVPWTDHYAWSDITGKPLTLTKNTTGFSISGGTTSKTLTVSETYTLGAACAKGVTDNSSATAVTSSDTNLITGRTLYYAGYVKSSGVTSVATGTGLTGGTITGTGTISIDSTYQTYISHGESAYNSLSSYLPLIGGTLTGALSINAANAQNIILNSNGTNSTWSGVQFQVKDIFYGSIGIDTKDGSFKRYNSAYSEYTILDTGNTSASVSNDTLTVSINGTSASLHNSWRGIQDNLTSSTNTTESLSAKQGYLLANGSARDNTKVAKTGDTMTGALTINTYSSALGLPQVTLGSNQNSDFYLYTSAAIGFNLYTNNSVRLSVTSGGNVGIGNVSPSYKFDVSGSFRSASADVDGWLTIWDGSSHTKDMDMGWRGDYFNIYAFEGQYYDICIGTTTGTDGSLYFKASNYCWGINTNNPSYKLHVIGDIYATGGVTSLSDIRKKDVVSYELPLNVEQIANAPTIKFLWKDKREEGEQVGTIAQYWEKVLPQAIKSKSGELSMSYGVAALVSAITTARKVVDHEKEIAQLKNRVKALEDENEMLKTKLIA